MSPCAKRKAPILWARTKDDRAMPLDPQPHPEGNVRLEYMAHAPIAVVLKKTSPRA